MGGTLPTFRLYRLDGAGRITTAEWLDAADDEEARAKARSVGDSARFELWDRSRLVDRVNPAPDA